MDAVDRIRAFNRIWTRSIGVLEASYLGSGLGVAEARMLHELGGPTPVRARDLARGLRLDEAQVSRALARFQRLGWLERVAAPDRRARELALTALGRARLAALQEASRKAIAGLLQDLAPEPRVALDHALAQALAALEPAEISLDALQPGDAGWVISRHAALYASEEGYDSGFEALVARILADFLIAHDPAKERGWIARRADGTETGQRLGSIFIVNDGGGTARLRLFLLEPKARGTGLAQRMLETALTYARTAGYQRMVLWTHESLTAAGRIYARNGFTLKKAEPSHAFGRDIVDQTWARDL